MKLSDHYTSPQLKNKVFLVTGASRGIGKGIAKVLGQTRAIVYITGRSKKGVKQAEGLPGNIVEAAELINKMGGKGIPIYCDHTNDNDVKKLFSRIRKDSGRLDLLVNNVWGGYEGHDSTFNSPFWKQPMRRWHGMFEAGVRAHFTASRFAAEIMIRQKSGLIINISAGDSGKFLHSTMYDTAKTAIDRLALGMAFELRKYNVTVLSLHPGFSRTERVLRSVGDNKEFDFSVTHSVEYVGRAIAALVSDKDIMVKSGGALSVGDLAHEYGFTDIDGRYVEAFQIPDYQG